MIPIIVSISTAFAVFFLGTRKTHISWMFLDLSKREEPTAFMVLLGIAAIGAGFVVYIVLR